MAYFTYFKTRNYDIKGIPGERNLNPITDILQRVRLKADFIRDRVYFSEYFIVDGQTPESLAFDLYGDTQLHWVLMYAQDDFTNPYYDWPLTYFDLLTFVRGKYGAGGETNIHHYEDQEGFVVDSDAVGATPITNLIHEEKLNEQKRRIRVIRPEFVDGVVKELKGLLR